MDYPIEAQPVSMTRQREVVMALLKAWQKYPYMRLTQLILAAVHEHSKANSLHFDGDLFYVENQRLIDALTFLEERKKNNSA